MIEFNGEICGACKTFLLKEQIKFQTLASLIAVALFFIPVILLSVFWRSDALIIFIPFVLLVIFSLIPPSKSSQKKFVPKRIYLDLTEETIIREHEEGEEFRMISSVKKVVDYGEWYYFIFNYEDRDPYFICQKELLTIGTIKEFEELFDGKIERRVN